MLTRMHNPRPGSRWASLIGLGFTMSRRGGCDQATVAKSDCNIPVTSWRITFVNIVFRPTSTNPSWDSHRSVGFVVLNLFYRGLSLYQHNLTRRFYEQCAGECQFFAFDLNIFFASSQSLAVLQLRLLYFNKIYIFQDIGKILGGGGISMFTFATLLKTSYLYIERYILMQNWNFKSC